MNHYRDCEVGNREPAEQTHSSYRGPWRRTREIGFIVSPYLLTRIAYECKFASLRYRGCDVNRISSRPWDGGMRQLRRSPPCARNVKEEHRGALVAFFVLRPARLITLKHEHESSARTCASCNEGKGEGEICDKRVLLEESEIRRRCTAYTHTHIHACNSFSIIMSLIQFALSKCLLKQTFK